LNQKINKKLNQIYSKFIFFLLQFFLGAVDPTLV